MNGVEDGPVPRLALSKLLLRALALDGEPDLARYELEHLSVRVAELLPVGVALDDERADHLFSDPQRNTEPDFRRSADPLDDAGLDPSIGFVVGQEQRRVVA